MSAFLAWIAALMTGEPNLGDPHDLWDAPSAAAHATEQGGLFAGSLLTLDAMLACWVRDRVLLGKVARHIDTYLAPVMA
jgi:hypothetical protein